MAAALPMAFMALQGVNAGAQYVAGRRAARGVEQQAGYEGDLLDLGASISDKRRLDALNRGRLDENRVRADTRGLIGAQRAALGASGLDMTTGSAVDVQADAAGIGEQDALTIRNNARREAYGYQVEAIDQRNRAELTRRAGRNQAAGMRDAAASTLLTGALDTYGAYLRGRPVSSKTRAAPAGGGGVVLGRVGKGRSGGSTSY